MGGKQSAPEPRGDDVAPEPIGEPPADLNGNERAQWIETAEAAALEKAQVTKSMAWEKAKAEKQAEWEKAKVLSTPFSSGVNVYVWNGGPI